VKLATDASALVAESLRARGRQLIADSDLDLYIAPPTWSETVHEIERRIDARILRGHVEPSERAPLLDSTLALFRRKVTIVIEDEVRRYEAEARDRVPRDPNDWPTVALALSMGIGIWMNDQDFFGCGVPVWTTETLLTHVSSGRAAVDR
jgi:predicted nucleic acid-binding protein